MLVDCLTLWLSNLMLAETRLDKEFATLRAAVRDAAGPVVLVANEVGLGLVPETPLGRRFRDAAGRLNQEIAALADQVVFIAAGLPLLLKNAGRASGRSPHPDPPPELGRGGMMGAAVVRRIPATIVTGFLGAGKTSLVRHLLATPAGHGWPSSSTNSANSASTATCCSAAATRPAATTISSSWPMAACAARWPTIFCRR